MKVAAGGALAGMLLTGCSGSDPEVKKPESSKVPTSSTTTEEPTATAGIESPSVSPTMPTSSPSSEAPVSVDARDLLVQRDDGGTGNWEARDPKVPESPVFSSNRVCSDATVQLFKVDESETEAAVDWFDPTTNNVLFSGQVARVYGSVAEARAAMADLRSIVGRCGSWREGPEPPGGWQFEMSTWGAAGLPKDALPWRSKVWTEGTEDSAASTWYISARYGNVVSTVSATSLDDVAVQAQRDVRAYADQAGRLILEKQGF